MMNKAGILSALALALACLFICVALFSCGEGNAGTEETYAFTGLPEYEREKLSEYVKPFEYTGLTVTVKDGESASEVLWSTIVDSVVILSYPEEQVEYYAEQERIKYMYYSSRDDIAYDDLLVALGITEEDMYEAARKLVREDLALEYVVENAHIEISEGEKKVYFEKYVEKFTELYGYGSEYVSEFMEEQIYDAMLYDKTMEYLLMNNTVIVE